MGAGGPARAAGSSEGESGVGEEERPYHPHFTMGRGLRGWGRWGRVGRVQALSRRLARREDVARGLALRAEGPGP